jgi:hypothetical protein
LSSTVRSAHRSSRRRGGFRDAARAAGFAFLLVAACDDDPVQPPPGTPGDPLRFDQLAIGQRSHDLFFHCDHYGDPPRGTQIYRPDTLLVRIVGQDGDRFRVEESLTPGSASRHGATNVWDPDTTYVYWLQSSADSLFVFKQPGSFPSQGSRIFTPIAAPETAFIGWQPDLAYHESIASAFVLHHQQLGQAFERLNVLQDNRQMAVDGSGYLFAYSGEHALVRWATYGWWTAAGHGWDLLP